VESKYASDTFQAFNNFYFINHFVSGDCLLTASDQLSAKITGSGDALYKGHPRIENNITGSGKVMNQN